MIKNYKLLIPLVFILFAGNTYAQINMGAIGDSMTDEYLQPNPESNQFHTDLAAHSWLEILAQTRSAYINFGSYAAPGGTAWPDNREFGYEFNWAKTGGAASRSSVITVGPSDIAIDTIGGAYGDTQALGLAQSIAEGQVGFAYVGLGSNDFFYQSRVFNLAGADAPRPSPFDATDPVWQAAAAADVSGAILAHIDTLQGAGVVNIIVAQLPPGTAVGPSSSEQDEGVLAAIEQTNTMLAAGLATRGIPASAFVDLFAWTEDPARQDANDRVHVDDLVIVSESIATLDDLAPDGIGPCNSGGQCATLDHAKKYISEDGLHPNTVPQALIANEVIKALNASYDTGIPLLSDIEILDVISDDIDSDGVLNADDNCTVASNPGQEDSDEDGIGNACDLPASCG